MLKTTGIGRLATDVRFSKFQSGKVNAEFSVAFDNPNVKEDTTFVKCVVWGKKAEFVNKYFHKGNPIIVSGRLRNNNYTDRNGVNRYELILVCDEVSFVPSEKRDHVQDGGQTYEQSVQAFENDFNAYSEEYLNEPPYVPNENDVVFDEIADFFDKVSKE